MCISIFLTYKAESVGRHLEITKEERNNFTDYNPWFLKNDFHKKYFKV